MRSGGVHKKRSQNGRFPTSFTSMNGGAFRVFLLILATTVGLWADGVAVPAVTTNAITTVTNAVSITTNSPSVTTNTVLVPEVIGSTNAPPVASSTNSVAEVKQEIPANLGAFSVIPRKDPFRLIKPEPEEAEPEIVAPRTVGVPQLAGISTLRGNQRAVLRISPPRGGKAEYVFLSAGDELHGVEVTKIDLSQGLVEVLCAVRRFRWSWIKRVILVKAVPFPQSVLQDRTIGPALAERPRNQVRLGIPPSRRFQGMD